MTDSNVYRKTQAHGIANLSPHMVYLLIDCSTSMDGDPLRQAKDGALRFAIDARSRGYRVGLIRFADNANALLNPDTGFTQAVQKLTAFGTTNLAAAIELATDHLVAEADGQRMVCVVTDGMPDSERKAIQAAKQAVKQDIQIMVIGTSGADRRFLAKLATTSGLSSYVGPDQLEQGISDMARLLPPPQ